MTPRFILPVLLGTFALAGCVGDDPSASMGPAAPATEGTEGTGAQPRSDAGATNPGNGNGNGTGDTRDGGPAALTKAAGCARAFGTALTLEYGRIDGRVTAIVTPNDTQCSVPPSDHVAIEVTMNSAVYRMLVQVRASNLAANLDPRVRYHAYTSAFVPHQNWAEGWHVGLVLDYTATLGINAGMFNPLDAALLTQRITDEIVIGEKVSVYAVGTSGAAGQFIRRNSGADGAIVLRTDTGTPRVLAFHNDGQMF